MGSSQNQQRVTRSEYGPSAQNPGVSVAMCTYNGAFYLREQLDSIAAQSLLPIELVVCDDQSSDNTIDILESFKRDAPFPVRIFVNPTQLGTTRNFEKALRLCVGEFIALSDQDDLWQQTKLQKLVKLLKDCPTACGAFSDAVLIDGLSRTTGRRLWQVFRFTRSKQRLFLNDPTALLLKHDVVTGATLVIRASLLDTFTHIPASWLHDGWLTWMAALKGGLQMSPEGLTSYRVHQAQQVGIGRQLHQSRSKPKQYEESHYRRVAGQFNDLLLHIIARSPSKSLVSRVEAKRDFLQRRASLPASIGMRIRFLLANLRDYRSYARGRYSIGKDLLAVLRTREVNSHIS